jgi:hypothetical protein
MSHATELPEQSENPSLTTNHQGENPLSITISSPCLRLLPLHQRAPLLSNQNFDQMQALHVTSVLVNALALGQRFPRQIEVVAAHGKVLPRLIFLVGGAEREVDF